MEGMSSEEMIKQPSSAPTLPESVEKQQQQQARAARPPPFQTVQRLNLWALLTGVISFAFYFACYILMGGTSYPSEAWQDTVVSVLMIGILWCSAPQAAAGALGLLLPCHRWRLRRAATYAAFALTVTSHCMLAGLAVVEATIIDLGQTFFIIFMVAQCGSMFMCAVFDLLGFLALLREEWGN